MRPGNQRSGRILLYSIVISDGFQLSVNSLLSEDHSANFLTFWLSEFVKSHGDIPKIFISDMSMAIINAAVRAFGQHANITEYLDTLFRMCSIQDDATRISTKPPPCFIRIDFAHLMNLVRKNKSLASCNTWQKVKDFYMRCVAILIQIKNLDFARAHILSVLIVAKSKTEGKQISLFGFHYNCNNVYNDLFQFQIKVFHQPMEKKFHVAFTKTLL